MPVSDTDLSTLAASHDIITLGMAADAVRRERHGVRTTFVRVAEVSAEVGAPLSWPAVAGEVRIVGVPESRAAALARVREVVAAAKGVPVSAFSLDDLEQLASREQITLRLLLEDLHAAGLDLVAEAPFDRLQDPRRSIEEVNIGGLALGRLTIHQLSTADSLTLFRQVAELQRIVAVIRAFAPLPRRVNPAVPDNRVRRREARGARASDGPEHPVNPGGLGALRAQACAGGADRRRRRRGCRIGG